MPMLDHLREARSTLWRVHNKAQVLLEWRIWLSDYHSEDSRWCHRSRLPHLNDSSLPCPNEVDQTTCSETKWSTRTIQCVFCENRGHSAEDCKEFTNVKDRTEKLKSASRCFLCLNRGHFLKKFSKKLKFVVQSAQNPIITQFSMQTSSIHFCESKGHSFAWVLYITDYPHLDYGTHWA
jgi:hypothetical protein